ncbi:hypothetical protein Ddc_08286 [Ditylenchus destructor]|nr:hypothetical protein Ddc_08286 [Ditylenchus destructor]
MYGHGQVAHRAHHSHHHSSYETTARGHDKKYRPRTHPKHVSSPHPSRPALHPHIEHPHANSPPHHHEQDQSRIEPHNSSVEKNDQHPTAHQTPPDKKEDEQKPQQQPKKPDQQQDHGKVDQNKANKASEIINTVISMVEIGALDPSCQMCAIELVESALFSELTPLKAFMNPSTLKRMKTLVDFIKGGKGQLLINEASSLLKNPAVKKVENTVTNGGQQAAKEVSKGASESRISLSLSLRLYPISSERVLFHVFCCSRVDCSCNDKRPAAIDLQLQQGSGRWMFIESSLECDEIG